MHPLYGEFVVYLDREDRSGCVNLALGALEKGDIDIPTLYADVLTHALNEMVCADKEKAICVWKEHVRSSIVRTVVECCNPHVEREAEKRCPEPGGELAAVICPPDEQHDIGARMVADFFTLAGFRTVFVGANTPISDFLAAVGHLKPKIVAISVTNYYNLLSVKKAIERIRDRGPAGKTVRILVGGNAFRKNPEAYKELGADGLLRNFSDIMALGNGKKDASQAGGRMGGA